MKLQLIVECQEEMYEILKKNNNILGIQIQEIKEIKILERQNEQKSLTNNEVIKNEVIELDITDLVKERLNRSVRLRNCITKYGLRLKLDNLKGINTSYETVNVNIEKVTVRKEEDKFIYRFNFEKVFNSSINPEILKNVLNFWSLFGIPVNKVENGRPLFGKANNIPIRLSKNYLEISSPFNYNSQEGEIAPELKGLEVKDISNKDLLTSTDIQYLIDEHLEV